MNERNGELPLNWVQAKREDLVYFAGRIGWRGLQAKEYTESGPLLLSVYNLNQGNYVDFTSANHISWDRYEESPEIKVQENDILLVKDGGGIGKLGIVKDLPCEATINSSLLLIRALEAFDPKYLFYFMKGPELQYLAKERIAGSATPHLFQKDIKNFVLSVAPLAEQRRIVARIEAVQERSRRAREALAEVGPLLERFWQSVLVAAFRGDLTSDWRAANPNIEPASEVFHRIRVERRRQWEQAELAKYEAHGRKPPENWQDKYEEPEPIDNSDLPELPLEWVWSTLEAISVIQSGVTLGQKKQAGVEYVSVPYIRVANVQRGYLDLSEIKTIEVTPDRLAKLRLRNGDLLFNEGGDRDKLGRGWVWKAEIEDCIHQIHVFRARLYSDELIPELISYYANEFGQQFFFRRASQTVNLASINKTQLSNFPIPVMSTEEQHVLARLLNRVLESTKELRATTRLVVSELDSLDQAILVKAFRGMLVPQAPNDEPASVLLERIREQRAQQAETENHNKSASRTQRRSQMEKKSPGLMPERRLLAEVLTAKGKPMSPEQLLTEAGYDNGSIEDFYLSLRDEIAKGRIREDRPSESNVMLEALEP